MADEDIMAEGEKLLLEAMQELSAEDLDRMLRALPSSIALDLVRDVLGSKLDPRRLKNVGSLLVGPLRKRPVARLLAPVERLSTGVLGTFHDELGEERFENPSADDLRDVLDTVLAQHPTAGVRCTLAWVVAEVMPAAEAARDVLVSDPRLCLPGWADAS